MGKAGPLFSHGSAPVNQKRTLDSVQITVYNKHKERCCRQTVSPFECAEITASLCEGGGYFFFVASNTRATTPRITRQNWNSSAYVTISITPFLQGGPTACNRMWQHLVLILPWESVPVNQKRTLDSVQITVYNKHKERCCRQTVSPFECAEITASLCEGGGYFFFVASNTRATTPRITRQNWNSSAYVTISITPFLQGGPTACNRMWQHLVLILPCDVMYKGWFHQATTLH